jgi:hypothetical protein
MKAIIKKSIKTFAIFAIIILLSYPTEIFSQGPPPWAPAKGYRAKTRHIYFPQQNFYYDIQTHHYLYLNNGNWLVSVAIPAPFISINLGSAPQIQLDYYGAYPYYYNSNHRVKYKAVKVKKMSPKKVVKIQGNNNRNNNNKVNSNRGNGNGHGNGKGQGKNK